MSEHGAYGLELSFTCPVCGDDVTLLESAAHHLHNPSETHQPNFPWKDTTGRCDVHFTRCERQIRDRYDFLQYEVPIVFTSLPAHVADDAVLEAAIDGMEGQHLGVNVIVPLGDDRQGNVFAWYHSDDPRYYAVTAGLRTPKNVRVTGEREEVRQMLHRWFTWEPDQE